MLTLVFEVEVFIADRIGPSLTRWKYVGLCLHCSRLSAVEFPDIYAAINKKGVNRTPVRKWGDILLSDSNIGHCKTRTWSHILLVFSLVCLTGRGQVGLQRWSIFFSSPPLLPPARWVAIQVQPLAFIRHFFSTSIFYRTMLSFWGVSPTLVYILRQFKASDFKEWHQSQGRKE